MTPFLNEIEEKKSPGLYPKIQTGTKSIRHDSAVPPALLLQQGTSFEPRSRGEYGRPSSKCFEPSAQKCCAAPSFPNGLSAQWPGLSVGRRGVRSSSALLKYYGRIIRPTFSVVKRKFCNILACWCDEVLFKKLCLSLLAGTWYTVGKINFSLALSCQGASRTPPPTHRLR